MRASRGVAQDAENFLDHSLVGQQRHHRGGENEDGDENENEKGAAAAAAAAAAGEEEQAEAAALAAVRKGISHAVRAGSAFQRAAPRVLELLHAGQDEIDAAVASLRRWRRRRRRRG